jgi:hypothetical protein
MGGYYNPRRGPTIADLMMDRGRILAEGASRSGEIWSNGLSNAGQLFARSLADQREQKLQEARVQRENANAARLEAVAKRETDDRAELDAAFEKASKPGFDADAIEASLSGHQRLTFRKSLNEANAAKLKYQEAQADYFGRLAAGVKPFLGGEDGGVTAVRLALQHAKEAGVSGTDELLAQVQENPAMIPQLVDSLIQRSPTVAKEWREANKPTEVSPGATLVDPVTKKPIYTAPIRETRSLEEQRAEALATGDTAKATSLLKQIRESAEAKRDPLAGQKDKFWVMRDGKPLRISESEYRPGDKPASTREQGRPVTSGDAGRIAEMDTALDEANELAGKITGNKATGVSAKIGTMVPDVVTEFTGWGTDAKVKEGTINLVKQIIGKGLEGGVLRKEDEYKYAKILPTISDNQEVVAGKMEGLWKALQQKRQNHLDSLSDAGYDTSKYAARAPRERATSSGGPKQFKTEAEADAGYAALASGEEFIGPDGQKRRKP